MELTILEVQAGDDEGVFCDEPTSYGVRRERGARSERGRDQACQANRLHDDLSLSSTDDQPTDHPYLP
eukprot:2214464-Rhodomonas_salina.1